MPLRQVDSSRVLLKQPSTAHMVSSTSAKRISGVVTSVEGPERGSLYVLVRPILNSDSQRFTIVADGSEARNASVSLSISAGVEPLQT